MILQQASLAFSISGLPLSDPVYVFSTVLLVIAIAPLIAQRSRVPTLVVLIVLGTFLGTNGIGVLARDQQLILLEKIGLLYIMLLAGLQIDLSNFQRLGVRSLIFGLLTFGIFNQPTTSAISQYVFVLSCLFVVAAATQLLGLDAIVGAFIAGLALNSLIPLNHSLMERIEFVGNSLFIPAFMISVGVLCNPRVLVTHPENLGIAIALITGAVGGKFLASWIAGEVFKYAFADVMVIFGLTMSRAGLVLVIALFGQRASLISEGLFNAIMLYVVVTCLFCPLVCDTYGKQVAAMSRTQTLKL